jgi:phosphohistidine phosphatase
MRRLMLLRHAKSDWSKPGERDHDRPLAPRGYADAPRIGAYMASHGLAPDLVVCSTARRARQTLDLAAAAFTKPAKIVHEPRVYDNNPDVLFELARKTAPDVHVLLLVGHNPSFQSFADAVTASGHGDARQRLREKFPTATLAVIDFPIDSWGDLHLHSGRLDRLITPRLLDGEPE